MTSRRHSNESQKRGTATEHAKQPAVLKRNPKTQQFMEEARADRADDSLEHLAFKLADFLIHVMRHRKQLWQSSETATENPFITRPLQSNVSSKIMTAGNCRSATTMYEYEN